MDLAEAPPIEASELLEVFLWKQAADARRLIQQLEEAEALERVAVSAFSTATPRADSLTGGRTCSAARWAAWDGERL